MLLKREMEKTDFILKEFQIIEADVLYRDQGFHSLFPVKKVKFSDRIKNSVSSHKLNSVLYFPFDANEIWLDELSDYQSHLLKSCPKGSYVL